MKAKLGLLLSVFIVLTSVQAFAATPTDTTATPTATEDPLDTSALDAEDTAATPTDSATTPAPATAWAKETPATAESTWATEDTSLNAAGKTIQVSPKGWVWNYKETTCDKDYFISNACNQCFEGWVKAIWEKITGLTDNWNNPNSTEQIIYKDEQKLPEMVNLWAGSKTEWLSNPVEPEKFWKFSDEIVWTDSATWTWKQEFLLEWNKTTNFLEWDLGASYALQSTEAKENDPVGMLKFSLNYHDTDEAAKEWEMKTHTECVAFLAWTPAPAKPLPPVTPQEATKVKTWPESIFIILAAMLLSFWLLKFRKKV